MRAQVASRKTLGAENCDTGRADRMDPPKEPTGTGEQTQVEAHAALHRA